ncbi:MAG: YebC/PmpR family DNA-binding transcriptional regulator [Candidatus Spechtbacterales bacterium]|nr:YebC/PmpR family DNA-binding transcriptional regulator [Candidatus Spechtbacterales bacterium]
MAGHSKWSNIKHKKEAADKKRAAVFGKLTKAITVSAQQRGGDPDTNHELRTLINKAKDANMPKDKIETAIKKGTGELQEDIKLEELIMEAYGPGGVAILISVITDNRNRTTAELRHLLGQYEAKLSGEGSAKWMFEKIEKEKGSIGWEAKTKIEVSSKDKKGLERLYEALDEHDDVQSIYSNMKK